MIFAFLYILHIYIYHISRYMQTCIAHTCPQFHDIFFERRLKPLHFLILPGLIIRRSQIWLLRSAIANWFLTITTNATMMQIMHYASMGQVKSIKIHSIHVLLHKIHFFPQNTSIPSPKPPGRGSRALPSSSSATRPCRWRCGPVRFVLGLIILRHTRENSRSSHCNIHR